METADPRGFVGDGNASAPTHVAPPAGEHDAGAPAVMAHVEDQYDAEIRMPAEPKRAACEVTVTTDASEYRAGDVISGHVIVNCSVPIDAKVRPASAPAPAPAPRVPGVRPARPVRANASRAP